MEAIEDRVRGIVDADTHVIESEAMWRFLDEKMWARRPVLVRIPNDTLYKTSNAFWLIDGNIFPKPVGKGGFILATPAAQESKSISTSQNVRVECRELTDPQARLADMDEMGVETQVIYPTLFTIYLTDDVDLEVALCRAYNRFVAQACAQGKNRLRWVLVPPLRSVEETRREMAWAKEHGAVGVYFNGIEGERSLADPYFFPIYEEAQSLDLPICIHTGAGCPKITSVFDPALSSSLGRVRVLPLLAFQDLVANRVPERFPRLRIGFVEALASWVPYLFYAMKQSPMGPHGRGPKLFQDYRLYVNFETNEDIPYLLNYIGEDHLIFGTDYAHTIRATEAQLVETMGPRTDWSDRVIEKLMRNNAQRFYGL